MEVWILNLKTRRQEALQCPAKTLEPASRIGARRGAARHHALLPGGDAIPVARVCRRQPCRGAALAGSEACRRTSPPDGTEVGYARRAGDFSSSSPQSGKRRKETTIDELPLGQVELDWSPDGRFFIYLQRGRACAMKDAASGIGPSR